MIIHDYASYQRALKIVGGSNILAYDIETTGLNTRSDRVIGFGVSNEQLETFYLPLLYWDGQQLQETPFITKAREFLELLKLKKLIGHNFYFDAEVTKNDLGVNLWDSLHADTIILKHTVDELPPFGLKQIAAKLYGTDELEEQKAMKESIKKNGGGPDDYYKADMDLMAKYCEQDTALTMRIYKHYSVLLKKEGLEDYFYEKEAMPLYKNVTRVMQSNGIDLDMPVLIQAQIDINADIAKIEDEIQESIKDYTKGAFQTYYLEKEYPVKASGEFVQKLIEITGLSLPKTKSGKYSLTKKNIDSLGSNTVTEFLRGTGRLDKETILAVQLNLLKDANVKYIFNLSSKHHLGKLFFQHLKEESLSKTPTGRDQVNDDFLDTMAEKYDWAKKLQTYNKLVKVKGSYFDRFLDEQEGGKFYARWLQHGTTSSRFSGDLQQLPKALESNDVVSKYTNLIRNLFIAGPGHKFIDADYSQLEVCVFAHDSRDPSLISMIKNKEDFYSKVAIDVLQLKGYSAEKKADNFLKKLKPEIRQSAKGYSLGIRYGLESFKLHHDLKISQEAAEEIIQGYFRAYPELKKRMDDLQQQAMKTGKVVFESGRIRHLPEVKEFVDTYGEDMLDPLKLYTKYNGTNKYMEMKELRKRIRNQMNNSLNAPIQGYASSILNRAAIAIMKEFTERGMKSYITAAIHDELLIRSPENEAEEAARIMQYHMENTTKLLVPLEAVPHIGDKYGEIK